jgi:hypothetical protein
MLAGGKKNAIPRYETENQAIYLHKKRDEQSLHT